MHLENATKLKLKNKKNVTRQPSVETRDTETPVELQRVPHMIKGFGTGLAATVESLDRSMKLCGK